MRYHLRSVLAGTIGVAAGSLVYFSQSTKDVEPVYQAKSAFVQADEYKVVPKPKVTLAEPSVLALGTANARRTDLIPAPKAVSGRKPEPGAAWYVEKQLSGEKIEGRVGVLEGVDARVVAGVKAGDVVRIPLLDGETVEGAVTMVVEQSNGQKFGGWLSGARPGRFSIGTRNGEVQGFVMLNDEKLVYQINPAANGQPAKMQETRLEDFMCVGAKAMPKKPAANGAAAAPVAAPRGTDEPVPRFDSRPTVQPVLYLDFNGEVVVDPDWNPTPIVAAPQEISDAQIIETCEQVSEDFRPFNISVTTDPGRYYSAPVGQRMRIIVTDTTTAGPGSGGVAYLNSFSRAGFQFQDDVVCWAFNGVGGIVNPLTNTISHEFGHTFGLNHDGRVAQGGNPVEEYFAGHGTTINDQWAPIMGATFDARMCQWSKGEYTRADNREDDLAIIGGATNNIGYVADTAPGGIVNDMPFLSPGGFGPVNIRSEIERTADVDTYMIVCSAGTISVDITNESTAANLDYTVTLLSSAGATIQTWDVQPPVTSNVVNINRVVAEGVYYLRIAGAANGTGVATGWSSYGSIGGYRIVGSIPVDDGAYAQGLDTLLTNPNLTFQTGGQRIWLPVFDPTIAHDGVDCIGVRGLVASDVGNSQRDDSWVETEVTGPAVISFWWRVECEPFFDELEVMVDGIRQFAISGNVPWQQRTMQITPGSHKIRWRYSVDSSINLTQNRAYVDELLITPLSIPIITSGTPPVGRDDQSYNYQIVATQQPFRYEAQGLPSGLTVNSQTGRITGIPTQTGDFNVTLSAANSAGIGTADFVLTVNPGGPLITSAETTTAIGGQPFSYQITARNLPTSFNATPLPNGVTVDTVTGIVGGSIAIPGEYLLTISAANNLGEDTQELRIIVGEGIPTITSVNNATGRVAVSLQHQIVALGSPTSYSSTTLPAGLSLDTNSGLISGVPQVAGTTQVTLTAINNIGNSTQTFTFSIAPERSGENSFANATNIAGAHARITSRNDEGATKESGEPNHAGNSGGTSVWWNWTALETGTVQIDTFGSQIDTLLGIYTGSSVSALTPVASNDDALIPLGTTASSVTISVTAGQVYRIAVDGKNGANGQIVLNITYANQGIYNGVLFADEIGRRPAGFVTLKLTSARSYTGTLTYGSTKKSIRGNLASGRDYIFISRTGQEPLGLELVKDLFHATNHVNATLADGSLRYISTMKRAMIQTDLPTSLVSKYTMIINAGRDDGAPAGNGYATLSVSPAGLIKATGNLADGAKISTSVAMNYDQSWAFFVSPYRNRGTAAGELSFSTRNIVGRGKGSDINGTLQWVKLGIATDKLFPLGFSTVVDVDGSFYTKPATGVRIIDIPSDAVSLALSGSDIVTQNATGNLGANNRFTATAPTGTRLTVNTTNGSFTGSVPLPGGGSTAIKGVFHQARAFGAGYHVGSKKTGSVNLEQVIAP